MVPPIHSNTPQTAAMTTLHSSRFKRVCVYCGSNDGNNPLYVKATEELGRELVRRGSDLVYGGGNKGLMGRIAESVHYAGGKVIGVIPLALKPREISGTTLGEQRVVADMHQRKAEMARESDAFIALPGGFGTLEELLEMITWSQLGIHDKPVGILDVDGYYKPLLSFFDKAVEQGFVTHPYSSVVVSSGNPSELLDLLEAHNPVYPTITLKEQWSMAKLGYTAADAKPRDN